MSVIIKPRNYVPTKWNDFPVLHKSKQPNLEQMNMEEVYAFILIAQ